MEIPNVFPNFLSEAYILGNRENHFHPGSTREKSITIPAKSRTSYYTRKRKETWPEPNVCPKRFRLIEGTTVKATTKISPLLRGLLPPDAWKKEKIPTKHPFNGPDPTYSSHEREIRDRLLPTLFFHPSQVTIDRATAIFSPETRKRAIRLTYVAVARLLLHCSLQSQFWHWCSRVTPLYDRVRERGRGMRERKREGASFRYERSDTQPSRGCERDGKN